jgi:hypothetical protein
MEIRHSCGLKIVNFFNLILESLEAFFLFVHEIFNLDTESKFLGLTRAIFLGFGVKLVDHDLGYDHPMFVRYFSLVCLSQVHPELHPLSNTITELTVTLSFNKI